MPRAKQEIPTWPGEVECAPRAGNMMFDAYNTLPDGLKKGMANADAIPNSCTQICLPSGVKNAAAAHGVHYGSSCWGENDSSLYPVDAEGMEIPDGTPVCPGLEFIQEGKQSGVQFFTYKCTEGDVINYGPPYK